MSVETGFVTIEVLENQPVEQGKLPKIKAGSLKVIPKTRLTTEDDSLVIGKTETYKIEEGVLVDGDIELPIGNYRFVLTSKASTFKFDSRVGSEHTSSNPLNLALDLPPEQVYPSVNYVKLPSGVSEKQALVVNDGVISAVDLETIKGPKGDEGDPAPIPTFVVGGIKTLPEGSDATVELVGSDPNYTLNFGIPSGPKGDQGDPGPEQSVKDTGWIDLKPFTYFPDSVDLSKNYVENLSVRRISNSVSVFFKGKLTAGKILLNTRIDGFTSVFMDYNPSPGVTKGEVYILNDSVSVVGGNFNGASVNNLRWTYTTADPWPDVLPGSPA